MGVPQDHFLYVVYYVTHCRTVQVASIAQCCKKQNKEKYHDIRHYTISKKTSSKTAIHPSYILDPYCFYLLDY